MARRRGSQSPLGAGLGDEVLLLSGVGGLGYPRLIGPGGHAPRVWPRRWNSQAGFPARREYAENWRVDSPCGVRVQTLRGLGAPAPVPIVTPGGGGAVTTIGKLADGPRLGVGPFVFDPNGQTIKTSRRRLQQQAPEHAKAIFDEIIRVSPEMCRRYSTMYNTAQAYWCTQQNWGPFGGMPIAYDLLTGRQPLYRITNPVKGGDWGLYVTIAKDADSTGDHALTIVFKRVPTDWLSSAFGAIWSFLKTIVGKIIETVQDLFGWVKNALCQASRIFLEDIARAIQNNVPVGAETQLELQRAGTTIAELKVRATYAGAKAVIDQLNNKFCPQAPPVLPDSGGGGLMIAVAIAVPAILFFLR